MTLRLAKALWTVLVLSATAFLMPVPTAFAQEKDEEANLPDSTMLARVEDRELTIYDFRIGYFNSDVNFRPLNNEAGRLEFLNSMINKEILALIAEQANRPLGFEDRLRIREVEEKALANVLFFRRVYEPASGTEAEMRALHPQFSYRMHLRHILFDDRETAERVRRELRSGRTTWSKACRQYSISPDRENDGDLGWRNRLSMRGDLGIKAFSLTPGAISEVAQNLEGFHVLQCLDREHTEPLPFTTLKRVIAEDIRTARTMPLLQEYYADVLKLASVTYDTTQIRWAVNEFRDFEVERMAPAHHEGDAPDRQLELTSPTPVFPQSDRLRVLATVDGTPITLDEFMKGYRRIPSPMRRKLLGFEAFIVTLNGIMLEPQMVELARQNGIDKDPDTVSQVEKITEQIRVEHLFADSVLSRIRVTNEDLQQYYKDREHQFVTVPSASYARIGRATEAGADSVLARLSAGETAADIIAEDQAGGWQQGSIAEIRQGDVNLYESLVFTELSEGGSTKLGPDSEGKFMVVHVVKLNPSRPMSLDEVTHIVDESIRNERAEALLNELLDRHRKRLSIESYPERLTRIRMVDPALDI